MVVIGFFAIQGDSQGEFLRLLSFEQLAAEDLAVIRGSTDFA